MDVCKMLFTSTTSTAINTLSLHDALPIFRRGRPLDGRVRPAAADADLRGARPGPAGPGLAGGRAPRRSASRSEEHTSELQSRRDIVCRLRFGKKNVLECCTHATDFMLHCA